MFRPTEKKIYPPEPILKEALQLVEDTGFDFNTLNSIAWLKMLHGRGKKPTKESLYEYVQYLKTLKTSK